MISELALGTSQAITTPLPLTTTIPDAEYACNLPAPSNIQVEEVGPTWVKVNWAANAFNAGHRVRIYKTNGNVLVATVIVPSNQGSTFVWGLTPQDTFYSVINAICKSGENSSYEAPGPEFITITDELVVTGFTPLSNPSVNCTILPTGTDPDDRCVLPSNGLYTFRIVLNSPPYSERQFQVNINNMDGIVEMDADNLGQNMYKIQIDGQDPDSPGSLYQIKIGNGVLVASFRVCLDRYNRFMVRRESLNSNYRIQEIKEEGNFGNPPAGLIKTGSNGYNQDRGMTSQATAAPNPFSETLEVFLPSTQAETVQLQLFNLSGQKVLDQQFAGAEGQYALSTAQLSPGFYMLHIEADGAVQTLKVVKSE